MNSPTPAEPPISPWTIRREPAAPQHATALPESPAAAPVVVAHAPASADAIERTMLRAPSIGAGFVWISTHGGAGASSLARASGHDLALTGCWPAPARGWPSAVALVARSNIAGLDAAARFLAEAAAGMVPDLTVLALVINADCPTKPSKATRLRRRELAALVPAVVDVAWIPAWRDTPYTPDRAATAAAAKVAALTNSRSN